MACDTWVGKLDAYLDGELDSAAARELSVHMRSCGECAAAALERVQVKRAVAMAGKRYEPSAEFRARVLQSVAAKIPASQRRDVGRPAGRGWKWMVLAVPALSLLVITLLVNFYVGREKARRQQVYSELIDVHVETLASASPVDVVSTDRHTVKPWFQGKIPFTFNLPELAGTDFTLLGGRVAYLGQSPGAQLIYQLRKHEISVFIFQDRGQTMGVPSSPMRELSFNMENWTQNGLRYFVVGDVNADDIEALSKLLRGAG
jgi:anti-sigma factor RsiW